MFSANSSMVTSLLQWLTECITFHPSGNDILLDGILDFFLCNCVGLWLGLRLGHW